jgi:hypothetical protein
MLMSAPVFADGIVYDGAAISYSDQQPVIMDGRTYVPIRDVFEKLGFEVDWNADTKAVTISNDYHNIMILTGSSKLLATDSYMNITACKLENSVKLVNGRTMLPLREILEKANYELVWDAETKTTTIKDNNDYEALKAEKEKLATMVGGMLGFSSSLEEYKVNTAKPVGKLTDEEKAWLTNLAKAADGIDDIDISDIELGDMSAEEIKTYIEPLFDKLISNMKSVECPDSLKDYEAAMENGVAEIKDLIYEISNVSDVLEGETDEVKESVTGSMVMVLIARIMPVAMDLKEASDNFMKAGNYDPEDEDFTELSVLGLSF